MTKKKIKRLQGLDWMEKLRISLDVQKDQTSKNFENRKCKQAERGNPKILPGSTRRNTKI